MKYLKYVNENLKCCGQIKVLSSFSNHIKEFLKNKGIQLHQTENAESVVERWNKTMKNRMFKMFTVNNSTVYYGKRDKLVDDYDSTRHSSKKITPVKACKKMRVKFILIFTEI